MSAPMHTFANAAIGTPSHMADAQRRLLTVEAVCAEEAQLGDFLASIDDDVRAAVHLSCAAKLRAALS